MAVPVSIEVGRKRVFACAIEWPGWCRSAKTEAEAIATLAAYARRYAVAAKLAQQPFPTVAASDLTVKTRVRGSASTDFGVPHEILPSDRGRLTPARSKREAAMVRAAWTLFDRVVASAPASLRKGPRGGGRDRDAIARHVREAEHAYAQKLGVRLPWPPKPGAAALAAHRAALVEALKTVAKNGPVERGWPAAYAARRLAWHALDHAWEIEDRSAS